MTVITHVLAKGNTSPRTLPALALASCWRVINKYLGDSGQKGNSTSWKTWKLFTIVTACGQEGTSPVTGSTLTAAAAATPHPSPAGGGGGPVLRLPSEILSRTSKQLSIDDLIIPTPRLPGLEITRSLQTVAAAAATTQLSEDGLSTGAAAAAAVTPHPCTMCNKQFTRADDLKKHLKTSHITSNCSVCGQMFKDKIALAKHQVEVHTNDKVFQCPQCEKGFKELRTLRLHLKIHNSEYPEQCSVCQKVFRTKWQLKQHQMDHGGERPYPCPECSFTCKTKQQLNEHRRKHSGEKAYSCSQCGTRFTYRNGLIKHTKLNRCPKKIVTPEGETIVKKRSRATAPPAAAQQLPSLPFSSGQSGNTPVTLTPPNSSLSITTIPKAAAAAQSPTAVVDPPTTNVLHKQLLQLRGCQGLPTTTTTAVLDQKLLAVLRRQHELQLQQSQQTSAQFALIQQQLVQSPPAAAPPLPPHINKDVPPLPTKSEEPVTSLLVNNPCLRPPMIAEKDQANSGLIQGNTTVPPSEKSPDNKFPSVQTSHHTVKEHGVLPESTVTELMAATGLSPQEIHLWAASLPAGSTVKVTHHFSSEPTAIKVKDNKIKDNIKTETFKQEIKTEPGTDVGLLTTVPAFEDFSVKREVTPQQVQQSLQGGSLMASSFGLPSYQESFAVDPNEVLSKNVEKKDEEDDEKEEVEEHPLDFLFKSDPDESEMANTQQPCSFINDANSRLLSTVAAATAAAAGKSLPPACNFNSENREKLTHVSSLMNESCERTQEQQPLPSFICENYEKTPNMPVSNLGLYSRGPHQQPVVHPDPIEELDALLQQRVCNKHEHGGKRDLHLNLKSGRVDPAAGGTASSPIGSAGSDNAYSSSDDNSTSCFNFGPTTLSTAQPPPQQQQPPPAPAVSAWSPDDPDLYMDLDLPTFPASAEPVEFSGFCLNDQDFSSIKTIVDQTFEDGRDVMDVISSS